MDQIRNGVEVNPEFGCDIVSGANLASQLPRGFTPNLDLDPTQFFFFFCLEMYAVVSDRIRLDMVVHGFIQPYFAILNTWAYTTLYGQIKPFTKIFSRDPTRSYLFLSAHKSSFLIL